RRCRRQQPPQSSDLAARDIELRANKLAGFLRPLRHFRRRMAIPDRLLHSLLPYVSHCASRLNLGIVLALQLEDGVALLALNGCERALGDIEAGRLAITGIADDSTPHGAGLEP